MRLPRDVAGEELARLLGKLGYAITRQTGSHLRLTREGPEQQHHVTIPRHADLKAGTLSGILKDIAEHLSMTKDELMAELWP